MSRQDVRHGSHASQTSQTSHTHHSSRARPIQPVSTSERPEIAEGVTEADRCRVRCIHPDVMAAASTRLVSPATYQAVASLFAALADPTRATLVHILLHLELCTCDLAAVLGMSDSAVSQHLRILRALHVVKSRRAGKFVYYSLDDAHVGLLLQVALTHAEHENPGAQVDIQGILDTLGALGAGKVEARS